MKIKAKRNIFRRMRVLTSLLLSVLLILSLAACGGTEREVDAQFPSGSAVDLGSGTAGELDARATAAQTFGRDILDEVQTQGEEVEAIDAISQTPGDTIYNLNEFLTAYFKNKWAFEEHLMAALGQAGLQNSPDTEVIRMDTLNIADLFAICGQQETDQVLNFWQNVMGGTGWTVEMTEQDGWNIILLYDNGVPAVQFNALWLEAEQYFYGCVVSNGVVSSLELDIVRTDYGFASQLYDPSTPAIYRFSFTDDGSWDSSIGIDFFASEQPDFLSGMETLTFGVDGQPPDCIQIRGTELIVVQAGDSASYTIDPSASTASGSNNNIEPISQTTLSAEAAPYARLWHGSPVLGSGWSERFALYDDGTFLWGANQMDGATRLRYLVGTWDIQNGLLILNCYLSVGWEGGEEVPNDGTGSYGSATVIKNPTVAIYEIEETLSIPVGQITRDSQTGRDTAVFNELQCWDYTDQSEYAMEDFWVAIMGGVERALEPKSKEMPDSAI